MRQNLLAKFVMSFLTVCSIAANAQPVYESNEIIKISVNKNTLTCKWIETAAHAGVISYPAAYLSTDEITGTAFKHDLFSGVSYLSNDFSCNPLNALVSKLDQDGKIEVQKNVRRYVLTYQDYVNGPVTAVEKSETVRLTFSNGNYVESTKSLREKK